MAEETVLEQNKTEAAPAKDKENKPERRTPRIDFKIGNFGDFADPDLYFGRHIRNQYERYKWGWIAMASPYIASNDYHDWHRWVNTAMKYVPEGKEFWFDEYKEEV